MGVDFGDPVRQMRDQLAEARTGYRAAPGKSENLIRRGDAGLPETGALAARQSREGRKTQMLGLDRRQDRRRLDRRPNRPDPEFLRQLQDRPKNRGMQMKMLMRVDVIELEARRAERLELGPDLRPHLPLHMGEKEDRRARVRHMSAKAPARVDEIWHGGSRQNRLRVE